MAQSFSLQKVLEIMQERSDDATLLLARLIASEQDAKNKLKMLENDRDEYAARFTEAAQQGIAPSTWRNYQDFLGRLDEAIEEQAQYVVQQAQKTVEGQEHWKEQRKRLKAIDTLAQRHLSKAEALALRQEQKIQDEFASRRREDTDTEAEKREHPKREHPVKRS